MPRRVPDHHPGVTPPPARGPCTSPYSNGVCLRGHQPGRTGADGRSSVLRLCAVSAFCATGHRGSAGSGSSLLSGIQCSTVSKPRCADLGRQSHAGILTHGDHGLLCEDPDDEQLHPREKDVVVPGTDRRYYQDPCRMGHHHGRQTHRTGGRAESGGYLCFKETVMA